MQTRNERIDALQQLPGCGLGFYSVILILGCLTGVVGTILSTMALLQAEQAAQPYALRPGSQVAVWQLKPMRTAKVTGLTEIPLAYHDESMMQNGTRACALMKDRLVQVYDGQGLTLAYSEIQDLTDEIIAGESITVTAHGPPTPEPGIAISCTFRAGEGGDRFMRQLTAETRKN